MRFRVQNVRKGHCEIWANEMDGQRYRHIAVVDQDPLDCFWRWVAIEGNGIVPQPIDPLYCYGYNEQFRYRADCINDCMRTALKRLVERAIEQQPKESPHWHSPRRDAWCTVSASYLFTQEELKVIKAKLMKFEGEARSD